MINTSNINPLMTTLAKQRIDFLQSSQWWSKEQFYQYQVEQLQELLLFCSQKVPYYQRVFRQYNINVSLVDSLNVLKDIPLLTKQDIQNHYDEFIPIGINKANLIHRTTGGSTGTPLTVYADLDFLSRDKANTVFYMQIAGYDPFNFRSLRIYGDKIPQELIDQKIYWYEKENKLVVSCFHYSRETFPLYIKAFNKYQPNYIHSRPSALLPLARYLVDTPGVKNFNLGAIFLDGEFLNEAQRDIIEKAFDSRVYNIYGHTEGCTVGVSCQHSRLLHFMPQVGVLELLDDDANEVVLDGCRGEMVVTGFNNRVFPLVRYRTMDIAVYTDESCSCGRNFKMIKSLDGRMQDFVINKSSVLVPLAPAVFNYNDMDWKGIKEFQVYQDKPGILIFKIVRERLVDESLEQMKQRLIQSFNKIFNQAFDITITFVELIPRTRIGKFRYLEQKLDLTQYRLDQHE
jgi:phenylacetate-CoA ligase